MQQQTLMQPVHKESDTIVKSHSRHEDERHEDSGATATHHHSRDVKTSPKKIQVSPQKKQKEHEHVVEQRHQKDWEGVSDDDNDDDEEENREFGEQKEETKGRDELHPSNEQEHSEGDRGADEKYTGKHHGDDEREDV